MASLVYHAGALGDFITVLPAVDRWRQAHPGERLILLGKPGHAAISAPPFDETWDAEARMFAGLFSRRDPAEPLVTEKLRSISSALVYAQAESPLPEALAGAGVKEIVRQDPFPRSFTPVVDYHLSLFPGPMRDEDRIPRVFVPVTEMRGPAPVVLHPGSGSRKKNWPLERFLELARRLTDTGERVAWVVGPAEEGMTFPSGHTVWSSLPLPELAARLALCRLFVGNDSGVTHLAAAAGCATVALFGESDQRIWSPRGRRVSVITSQSRGMKGIRIEDVLSVCQDLLEVK
jgi:heptosyltransferase III